MLEVAYINYMLAYVYMYTMMIYKNGAVHKARAYWPVPRGLKVAGTSGKNW